MKKLIYYVIEMAVVFSCGWYLSGLYVDYHIPRPSEHPLCQDTRKAIAYVAIHKDEWRCFMMNKEYPHKTFHYYIDEQDYDNIPN